MNEKMKIFLYEVSEQTPVIETIHHIKNLDLEDRVKNISGYDMKLEEIEDRRIGSSTVILMDFCKHRQSGPGRAKRDQKIQGFDLEQDEAFGEMTTVLYDPETHFIVIQYNHYGPRAGAIASYLSEFFKSQVTFKPRLRDDVLAEIDKKQYNTSLSFSYSYATLTEEHGKLLGIAAILNNTETFGDNIGEVVITVKKKRGSYSKMENQTGFLKKILRFVNNNDEGVIKSARVKGAMTPEDEPELLDLINAKISEEREGLVKDEETKMYSFQSRCKLLIRSFKSWKKSGVITYSDIR